jgi:hypothetical protein
MFDGKPAIQSAGGDLQGEPDELAFAASRGLWNVQNIASSVEGISEPQTHLSRRLATSKCIVDGSSASEGANEDG